MLARETEIKSTVIHIDCNIAFDFHDNSALPKNHSS